MGPASGFFIFRVFCDFGFAGQKNNPLIGNKWSKMVENRPNLRIYNEKMVVCCVWGLKGTKRKYNRKTPNLKRFFLI